MKNNIKFAFRYLKRDLFYSFLNVAGFAIGLSCSIVILLYLQHELSYERHNLNADRIYRMSSNFITSGEPVKFTLSSPSLGPKLSSEFPEIESFVRINYPGEVLVRFEDRVFYEPHVVFADSSLFDVFTYSFISGDKETIFKETNSIVLTKSLSQKYFGDEDPLGKEVQIENFVTLVVTGVVEDLPDNSHVPVDGIVNYKLYDQYTKGMEWPLYEISVFTFVLLPDGYDLEMFWEKFPVFYDKYAKPNEADYNQVYEPIFHRLTDIHYNADNLRFELPTGKKSYLYIFGSIGIFILLLSAINYINMATARASGRLKEIGVKKVCGSTKTQLLAQFLTESFLTLVFSLGVALIVTELILEFTSFNSLVGIDLEIDLINNYVLTYTLLIILLIVGFLSGIFPALFLARSSAVSGLIRTTRTTTGGKSIRDLLVVLQFTISIVVVNLMFLMNKQMKYINEMDLGFNKSETLTIRVRDTTIANSYPTLRQELLANPNIYNVTSAYNRPGSTGTGLYKFEKGNGFEEHNFHVHIVNAGYLDVMGIKLLEGRDFDETITTDPGSAVLVNKALIKALNWEEPIGKEITQGNHFKGLVVGIIEDFHFQSLYNNVQPMMLRMQKGYGGNLMMRFNKDRNSKVLSFLETKWMEINPDRPFVYHFLDEEMNKLYKSDSDKIKLVRIFSALSIIISCIGLLGLTSYTAEKKTKEVGIRKALGATVNEIVFLMFKSILILIIIAFFIASLSSSFFLNIWLENFAYQTNVSIWIFALTGFIALALVWLTVSYHFLKVARKNPVEALRYE